MILQLKPEQGLILSGNETAVGKMKQEIKRSGACAPDLCFILAVRLFDPFFASVTDTVQAAPDYLTETDRICVAFSAHQKDT